VAQEQRQVDLNGEGKAGDWDDPILLLKTCFLGFRLPWKLVKGFVFYFDT
jgi:hypothetical protein